MAEPRVFMWTGGTPRSQGDYPDKTDHLLALPPPAPLRQSAHIGYQWGGATIGVHATACSVRTTPWRNGQMTWLHCQAMTDQEITPEVPVSMMTILIPAIYVTRIEPGMHFHIGRYRQSGDVGVFPPHWPAPTGAVPLAEIERVLVDLLSPELN